MDLSKAWLMEAAGWKAVKEGGMMLKAGAVSQVTQRGGLVKGLVMIGRKAQISGLNIRSATDVDNLCRCRESLRDGMLCAHSAAVVLAAIEGQSQETVGKPAGKQVRVETAGALDSPQNHDGGKHSNLLLQITLETIFTNLWEKNKFPIRLTDRSPEGEIEQASLAQSHEIRAYLQEQCQLKQGSLPGFLILNRQQASECLKLCVTYPYFAVDQSDQALGIAEQSIRLKLHLTQAASSEKVLMRLSGFAAQDQILLKSDDKCEEPWVYHQGRQQMWPVRLPEIESYRETSQHLLNSGEQGLLVSEAWLAKALPEWSDVFEIDSPTDFKLPSLNLGRPEFELQVEGSLQHVRATIRAYYGGHQIILGQSLADDDEAECFFPYLDPTNDENHGGKRYFTRNTVAEKTALSELTAAGFSSVDQQGVLHLRGQNEVLHFHVSVVPRLQSQWRKLVFAERYRTATAHVQAIRPVVSFDSGRVGEDWFSCAFELENQQGATTISESEIRRYLATGQNQVRENEDGSLAVIDRDACEDWFEVLKDCNLQQEQGGYHLAPAQRDYIESSVSYYQNHSQLAGSKPDPQELNDADFSDCLADLEPILRPYQRDGIAWLYRKLLTQNGGGAILADEMGLGKTLQTLAVSRLLKTMQTRQESQQLSPVLVVCPTSLIDNWDQEIKKFTPEYQTLLMRGTKRSGHFKNLRFADVVITSYALMVRDIEQYQKQHFRLLILDEASYIRNPSTQNARCAKKLNADSRLALTGTPIENSVLDIWSISDFARPGYLGTREEFKQHYEKPIQSGKASTALHQRFRRRLKPLILRRTKSKVATDLPAKLEEIIYCDLNSKQKALYAGILRKSRNKINAAFSSGDERAARVNMLTALLRLRQICCDARLLKSKEEQKTAYSKAQDSKSVDSAKLLLLRERLQEAMSGGHRVLIFSQFVSMLKLIRADLQQSDFYDGEIAYLDGSSQDRAEQVARFQKDENVKVFLISLKAGGYGLNLTAADTVMHFDPWWNPAVEAQATDRAHRIGQSRIVTSYKFIARDTVEEKILKLQQQKRDVFDAAIDDQAPMMRGLNTEDLRELLDV
ncbi:MAG: DEAD/DEAH box helicase [Verrucomicrobiales bacterium]|nr:DEAD/DEAH box helicase [Verrucomicrobiales bacterium]